MLTAAQIARTLAASPAVVYFVKHDGSLRRMLTAPTAEGVTLKGTMARVFDAEKGAWRTVNTATITDLRPLRATRPNEQLRAAAALIAERDRAGLYEWQDVDGLDLDFDSYGY